jgi:hypothetical protein
VSGKGQEEWILPGTPFFSFPGFWVWLRRGVAGGWCGGGGPISWGFPAGLLVGNSAAWIGGRAPEVWALQAEKGEGRPGKEFPGSPSSFFEFLRGGFGVVWFETRPGRAEGLGPPATEGAARVAHFRYHQSIPLSPEAPHQTGRKKRRGLGNSFPGLPPFAPP